MQLGCIEIWILSHFLYIMNSLCNHTLFFVVELNNLFKKIDSKSTGSHGFQCKPRVIAEASTLPPPPNAPEWTLRSTREPAAMPQRSPTLPAIVPEALPEADPINAIIGDNDAEDSTSLSDED